MRIMVWNIERFRDGIFARDPSALDTIGRVVYNVRHNARRPTFPDPPPVDVFAILEVYQYTGEVGIPLPLGQGGTQGVIELFEHLKGFNSATTEWRLVPPLSLATGYKSEGVAIFYNNKQVELIGPNKWDGDESLPPSHVDGDHNYAAPWDTALPAPYYASRVQFYQNPEDVNSGERTFPDASYRRPCMVQFKENFGKKRSFDLFFVHTTPPLRQDPRRANNPAVAACRHLADLTELRNPASDGTVVLGDFNVNANSSSQWGRAFRQLLSRGYKYVIGESNDGSAPPTTIRKYNLTVPPSPAPSPAANTYYWDRWSIDNAFYLQRRVVRQYVLDPVIGHPDGVPSQMEQTLEEINTPPRFAIPGLWKYSQFTANRNYGQVRNLSDHLPIFIEV